MTREDLISYKYLKLRNKMLEICTRMCYTSEL